MPQPEKVDPQLVYLDPARLDLIRINRGLSRKQLANSARLAVNTVLDTFRSGNGLQPSSARKLAQHLGCEVTELLAPWDPRYQPPGSPAGLGTPHLEWEAVGYLEQGRMAANGLYYIVCRMQHRHLASRTGRGKFYHLSLLSQQYRADVKEKLSRHAEVCVRVGRHPNIAYHLSSAPAGNEGWWVIDDWLGERTLSSEISTGSLQKNTIRPILLDIAQGLEALHRSDVVFRELAPSRVILTEEQRCVLTDFELAKLLDGSPSVSSEWPEDPFRAPEVDGGEATPQADLYSFGCLAAALLSGQTPPAGAAQTLLREGDFPKRLGKLLSDCVEPVPHRRPEGVAPLIRELIRWKEK